VTGETNLVLKSLVVEHLLRIKCAAPECGSSVGSLQRLLASSVDMYLRAKCRRPSSRPYGPTTKKPKLEQEATGDVSPQSAEPTNTAESDSDTE